MYNIRKSTTSTGELIDTVYKAHDFILKQLCAVKGSDTTKEENAFLPPFDLDIFSQETNTLTQQEIIIMHPKITMDYICHRKLDDALFSTSAHMNIETINGILATRAGVSCSKEKVYQLRDTDSTKELVTFLMESDYKPYGMFPKNDVDIYYTFDVKLEAFGSYICINKKPNNFGYHEVTINGVDNHPMEIILTDWLNKKSVDVKTLIVNEARANGNKCITTQKNLLEVSKIQKGLDAFYPYIEGGIEESMRLFHESTAPVLVLLGPPGVGKSTFMRTMLALNSKCAHLTYDIACAQHPDFLQEYYTDKESDYLIMEDIDILLTPRKEGNAFMSSLLNRTDGLIAHRNKKLVLSTNLGSVRDIDEALLRTGRCHDLITFRNLTPQEAEHAAASIGLPDKDYSTKKEWSLSDVLNPGQVKLNSVRAKQKVGF